MQSKTQPRLGLARNRNFLLLLAGQNLSAFGDWFRTVTTIGLVYVWTGSAANLSLLFISSIFPMVVVSSFLGPVIDRFPRRTLMIVADLARVLVGCGFVLMIPLESPYLLYLLLAINGAFSGLYLPARSALIPEVIKSDQLPRANSILATSFSAAMLISTGLGGLLADLWSAQTIYLIDAATFLVSALCLVFIKPTQPSSTVRERVSYIEQVREGMQEIKKSRNIQCAIWILMAREAALSVVYVIFSLYILQVVNQGNFGLGVGHTATGIGQILGGLTLAAYFKKQKFTPEQYRKWATLSLLLLGFFHTLSYQLGDFWIFLLLVVVANLWYSPIDVLSSTSIMTYAKPEVQGRIFASSLALSRSFYLGGFMLMAIIGNELSVSTIAWCMGGFLLFASLLHHLLSVKMVQVRSDLSV
ncbi:MFS transporter [Brevibacillus humidisoli]|uniref:MFS transporter n=1 Tax=Brevibacillus humidisoli TaxID=2895522 RepID=UPI001E4F7857|nr:MFS transporter [Brevibacillus humidisoli]UFJ43180.1 MFS transporter [Brevibacillus humidisoli]